MNKFKSFQKENIKMNFMVGLSSFLSYFFLMASIDSTSLTNIVFISRLYPFLVMFYHTLTKPENISNHQLISFIIYVFSFLIIFFPALYRDTGFGVVYCLLSILFKFTSLQYLSNAKGLNVDLLMLNIGFFNAFFGGIIVITTFDEVDHIGKFIWLLILLNALCTYFMKIFLNKVLKGDDNEQKLMFLSVIALLFIMPFDFYVYEQNFYYNYLVLIFSFEIGRAR
jgi:drug/metabolite transporter (DMT)-like permease